MNEMNESDKFTNLYKTAEADLYERGNCYKSNEKGKSTLREIRICTPDHYKYEYEKIKEERERVANEEKKKYKVESENLKNRLKNCYNYYDLYQYFIKQSQNLEKVKLNLINEMTDDIFHTKAVFEEKPLFNQLDDELTQYIHDCDSIENKEIEEKKHLDFIKGLSKTFDQSIKKITKMDIKRIYETGTVVSMAKKRSKYFNENKNDESINRTILDAARKMNKEMQKLDNKDGIALPDKIAKRREIMITNALQGNGRNKKNQKGTGKDGSKVKEDQRRPSIYERRRSTIDGHQSAADTIKMNEELLKNNRNRRISITQIKQSYEEESSYVRRRGEYAPPMFSAFGGRSRGFRGCIYEHLSEPIVDEFGHTQSYYKPKKPILSLLYPDERSIITKSIKLRNSQDNAFIYQLIRSHPAFKKYSVFILKEICKIISFKILKRNQIVYKKGDNVGSWYVIMEGSVGFYGIRNNQSIPLHTFSENEDFCKISLYSETPQNFTVKVLSDVGLFACLEKDSFIHIIQWMWKYDLMVNQKFFRSIPELNDQYDSVIEKMSNICYTLHYTAGSTIIKENDIIKYLYFIKSGTCEVSTSLEIDVNQEMKYIIEKYSGYGSRYDMPKFTDPYDRRIISESIEECESQSEETINSDYSSYCDFSDHKLEKCDDKQKSDHFLDSLIPPDIRVKQVVLGELNKYQFFGESAAIALDGFQKNTSPVTIKCQTDVTIVVINIFDLYQILPKFFTLGKFFNMTKKDAQIIYNKQKEESYWIKVKVRELTSVLKEQSGDCLKKYCIERKKI